MQQAPIAVGIDIEAAKFAPPSLHSIVPRAALFEALERVTTPARWLCAPSGAGKSTLVAAYVGGLRVPVVWYRLDERDNDPAFFFAQWSYQARQGWASSANLPEYSIDAAAAPAQHAGRLLRALTAYGAVALVFDDEQVITSASVRSCLAVLGCSGVEFIRTFFCSQQPPGSEFYGALAKRALGVCWNIDLSLSPDDCAVLGSHYRLDDSQARELRALTGGHAAAMVLACELLRASPGAKGSLDAVAGGVHGFLLEQLVRRLSDEKRQLLLESSYLPQLRLDLVQQLVPGATAEDLEALADQGLLIRHSVGGTIQYTTHALVQQGARRLADGSGAALRCARVLAAADDHEDAFELLLFAGHPDEAARELLRAAPSLVRAQRISHLLRSVERLPASVIDALPELTLWCGQAALGLDPTLARAWLARSYDGYERLGDEQGAATAAACVLIGYNTDMQDIHDLQLWLRRFADADRSLGDRAAGPMQPILLLGRVCECNLGTQIADKADRVARACEELMLLVNEDAAWPSADQQSNGARLLFEHFEVFRTSAAAQQVALMLRTIALRDCVSPILRARWWMREARLYGFQGDRAVEGKLLLEAKKIADASGSAKTQRELGLQQLESLVSAGRLDEALDLLPALENAVGQSAADSARFGRLNVRLLLMQGRLAEALERSQAALDAAAMAGYSGANAREYERERAVALAAVGCFGEAAVLLERLAALLSGVEREAIDALADLCRYLEVERKDPDRLARAFAFAARTSWKNFLPGVPALATLCSDALDLGIQPDFVKDLIKVRGLVAPVNASAHWPWPVRVRTLGGFGLEIDGAAYRPGHKPQDKPLELLKLIAAAEATGQASAERQWLTDRLWPDADPGNARKSLDMTISRLRKLLGSEEAIEWADGRLRLNPELVWLDVRWLLRAVHQLRAVRDQRLADPNSAATVASSSSMLATVRALTSVYAGPFLQHEDEAPWQLGARSQIAQQFRSSILLAMEVADPTRAEWLEALERALAVDPTAEELGRLLMEAYLQAGDAPAAVRIYQRVKAALGAELDAAPSARTEKLHERAVATTAVSADPSSGARRPAHENRTPLAATNRG